VSAATRKQPGSGARKIRGVTLIELMVALLLGLLVVGGAIAMFMSNRKTYMATESLGRIQEGGRIGFELFARDIREADGTPCRQPQPSPPTSASVIMLPIANLLTSTAWWANWGNGLLGYDNGGFTGSVAGTDAIELHSANVNAVTVTSFASATFTASTTTHGIAANDVVLACDGNQGTIFVAGTTSAASIPVATSGNCGTGLGLGATCGGTAYTYGAAANGQAMLAKVRGVRWYVKANGHGGNSLYQQNMGDAEIEIIDGVRDLQLTYLLPGANTYATAASVTTQNRWKDVSAVRIVLDLEGQQSNSDDRIKAGTDGNGLRRRITHVVTLRNRNA
jgi:type IV pilus assembly protein PilW